MKKTIFIFIYLVLSLPLLAAGDGVNQNLSVNSIAELAALYTSGGTTYNTLEDGDTCEVVIAADKKKIPYILDLTSGETETADDFIAPDEISNGSPYSGDARWVKQSIELIITDTNGVRYRITISPSGVLTATSL